MANFISIENNKYKIEGTLTEEDINTINSFKNRTTLILDNTVGLSSELVSKIKPDRIVFSIKGGLDYDTKEKYKTQKYIDRTYVSPKGLWQIINYFEYNEKQIDPNWNEYEKAMFLYNALVVDMEYKENYEKIQSPGTTERSLNGILYGKLVCAGFAQVYKEMLDRVGIKNYYQNQKDVHAFNIIEIDGKKYGVDVTWDNNRKENYNGKCNFDKFGQDPDFYDKKGHQLYKEEVDFEKDWNSTKIVYDKDEEIFDLSLISNDQLKEYYSHIQTKINSREPRTYNLQEQPLNIKNKYLPVDTIKYNLEQEAVQEYFIIQIMDFLKKRNALNVDSQLTNAFYNRKGYILDIGNTQKIYNIDLTSLGIVDYEINDFGDIRYKKGDEIRYSSLHGIGNNQSNITQEEINNLCNILNNHINQYINNYVSNNINNIDILLNDYEYKPDEWDNDRAIESANIYTKLAMIVNSRDYLIQSGIDEQEIDNIIQRINNKYNEVHKPYENNTSQKEYDLDYLYDIFADYNMVWQTIEYDLEKQITEEEFISLYCNVDYMIRLFEKYIIINEKNKFQFNDYSISKEDLQQLLNEIIQDYKIKRIINESSELEETKNSEMNR